MDLKRRSLIFLYFSLLVGSLLFGQNWVFLASGNSQWGGIKFYIDTTSVGPRGEYWEAWVLAELDEPYTVSGSDQSGTMQSMKFHYLVDIDNKQLAIRESIGYSGPNAAGDIVADNGPFDNDSLQWQDVVPGAYASYIFAVVKQRYDAANN